MDNLGYLFAVFGIVWLVVFIYVLALIRDQNRMRKEIMSLQTIIKEKGIAKSNN